MNDLTATPDVNCSRCGAAAPAGTRQCVNAKCRALLPGNPGRTAEVPGMSAVQRRGKAAIPDAWRQLFDSFYAAVVKDLGGTDALTLVEAAYVEILAQEYVLLAMLSAYLGSHGVLTERGRVRTALTAFQTSADRFDRFAQRIGTARRAPRAGALDSYFTDDDE